VDYIYAVLTRAAIEFNYIYPVRNDVGERDVCLVAMRRSFVDGLTGAGRNLASVAENRGTASLAVNLDLAKHQLERKRKPE
jgi:hypothetical protein